jgi:hypothetical protein
MKNYIIGLLFVAGYMFASNSALTHCAETNDVFPSYEVGDIGSDLIYLHSFGTAPVAYEIPSIERGGFSVATMEGVLLPFAKGLFPLPRGDVGDNGNNG